jgi:hypothetical protein
VKRTAWLVRAIFGVMVMVALSACVVEEEPVDDLFPPQVGEFLRTSGPATDPATEVDQATYVATSGIVLLHIKRVGADNVEVALSELPPMATNIGYDAALGQRNGVFFTFAEEYHAAWGNGDWVFVLSAPSEVIRAAFLSSYGY